MKTLLVFAAFLATVLTFHYADAADRPAKPVVCLSYDVLSAKGGKVGVCYDGKRPALFRAFSIVELPDPEGQTVKVMLGWR